MPDVQQPRWQPDYRALTSWRATALESLRAYPASGRGAYLRYHDDPAAFIDHWAEKNVELVSAARGAISCRTLRRAPSLPLRHVLWRERHDPSPYEHGVPLSRDFRPRDAWPLPRGGVRRGYDVLTPSCGVPQLSLTCGHFEKYLLPPTCATLMREILIRGGDDGSAGIFRCR